ncbi:MAG: 50S ribosomal protein L6 [Candidatus Pacebacteria bacterium]|nr:50S ribosomal protein L6 [Candidatus Paceibacterota bacterium]
MSRLAKNTIPFPSGTTVSFTDGTLTVKGPLGTLTKPVNPVVSITVSPDGVNVAPVGTTKLARALTGTFASHIRNMMKGVTEKYAKKLELQGIGYRVELQGKNLKFQVGFSHPVLMAVPAGVDALVEKNFITISGIDKEAVGQFAANVRAIKKPEPYKGKGIRYEGEYVRQKQGKKAAA